MLIKLTLKNFRKAVDSVDNFTQGLNVIRGANEGSKTTRLEAIAYAFYGTAALRTSLEECVTWGEKVQTLKVSLVYSSSGTTYRFERSKAGASVYRDAEQVPFVTGQREVTAFSAELLGADAKTASMLMMASQADLRGALDQGPAAVSGLISKLADFALLDTLLGRAQERLLLGSATPMHGKLTASKEALDKLALCPPSDPAPLLAEVESLRAGLGAAETARDGHAALTQRAQQAVDLAQERDDAHARAQRALATAEQRLQAVDSEIATANGIVAERPTQAALDEAAAAVEQARRQTELVALHREVTKLAASFPELHWEGDGASFAAEVQTVAADMATLRGEVREQQLLARSVRARKITSGKCPTCGHAAVDDAHVQATNDALEAEAALHDERSKLAQARAAEVGVSSTVLAKVQEQAAPYLRLAGQIANRDVPVALGTDTFPPRPVWLGQAPCELDLGQAQRTHKALVQQANTADQASGRLQVLVRARSTAVEQLGECQAAVVGGQPTDLADLQAALQMAAQLVVAWSDEVRQCRADLAAAEEAVREQQRAAETHAAQVKVLEERIAETEADLRVLAFNNNLLKKLKAMKPLVSDHLWGIVLTSVSSFFTQIRGEASVVTKDGDGFKVNGREISALSGSTIDALAIAVRVALTRTFIPHATVLMLDEPWAACDVNRAGSGLGFLASAGFEQVLLCSHDPLSESVASNVVTVGE